MGIRWHEVRQTDSRADPTIEDHARQWYAARHGPWWWPTDRPVSTSTVRVVEGSVGGRESIVARGRPRHQDRAIVVPVIHTVPIADGSVARYVQLAHHRRVEGRSQAQVLLDSRRQDKLDPHGLRRLVASINADGERQTPRARAPAARS